MVRCILSAAVMVLLLSVPGASRAEDAAATRKVAVDKINLEVPSNWKDEEPSSSLRLAQFSIPPAEGDSEAAELAVFPPFGGTADANVKRWIGQFEAEGREVTMTKGTTEQGDYVLVALQGTYLKPDGPPVLRKTKATPGSAMLGVIFKAKAGGNYFFKMTGPEKTVLGQVEELRTAMGATASDEQEYKLSE